MTSTELKVEKSLENVNQLHEFIQASIMKVDCPLAKTDQPTLYQPHFE